jgi:hypothetical protein
MRALCLVAAVLCVGCQAVGGLANSLGELQEVRRQVAAASGHDNIGVNLSNGRLLAVSVINSPFKALPDEQRKAKAREIAGVAYKAFPGHAKLEDVAVVFAVHKTYVLLFNFNDSTDAHFFPVSSLQ